MSENVTDVVQKILIEIMGTTQVLCQWLDPMTKIRY